MITKKFEHITYSIILEITSFGVIDKTDIIGSLYNQMRDVLKKEVSFEKLVKEGKLGNIDIKISKLKTKTKAKCIIPTNLEFKQVCLLAAKCEQITKIGHAQGQVEVISIEHSQKDIEETILKRAEELELKFSKDNLVSDLKKEKKRYPIIELKSNIYSTKNIKRFKKIILVEGRSDVKTLVENNILNVISINGSHLDILQLKNEKWFENKELVVFFDGDSSAKKLALQIKKHFNISKEIYAPKDLEVSNLNKKQIEISLNIQLKEDNKEKDTEDSQINENKTHFYKNEYFIIENYLTAVKDSKRIVGFDSSFGIIFDEPISKLKQLDFSNVEFILYDGLCENIFAKKIKNENIKCIIAKSFSDKIKNVECITFDEFEHSIVE